MKTFLRLLVIGILLGVVAVAPVAAQQPAQRVISMLPSITQILFALGAEDQVVGVTQYCKFPPEAQNKTSIGGLMDANIETIFSLQPDLIILSNSMSEQTSQFGQMKIPMLEIESRSVEGIMASIATIGRAVGRQREAADLLAAMQAKIDRIQRKTEGLAKPKILITYLRPFGEGSIREVYIAGNHTYFNDLIVLAGGVNAYQGPKMITSPIVSPEGILQMDPDVIIEILGDANIKDMPEERIINDWRSLPQIAAYQNDRIHVFNDPKVGIPGAHLADVLENLARRIHPEADWRDD